MKKKKVKREKPTKKDLSQVFEDYQKTIDFHMTCIQGIFPNGYKATLIVRGKTNDEIVVIYSEDPTDIIMGSLEAAIKRIEKNKKKKKKKEPLLTSDKNFQEAVRAAVEDFGVTPGDFIQNFDMSKGTISRWMRGKSLPEQRARPPIMDWIKDRLKR